MSANIEEEVVELKIVMDEKDSKIEKLEGQVVELKVAITLQDKKMFRLEQQMREVDQTRHNKILLLKELLNRFFFHNAPF